MYGQMLNLLDKSKILRFSRENGGERYVKHFYDSFMLRPSNYTCGDIVALDRAYIDYAKFEELTRRGVIYVTKMKKSLTFDTVSDTMYMHPKGLMECRVQHVIFHRHVKNGEDIEHHARIITYVDIKK